MAKWVTFSELPSKPKTQCWRVENLQGVVLGEVRWYGPWRRYSLFTFGALILEHQCLMDIGEFCKSKTVEHRGKNSVLTSERKADV